jgi:uncharacterized protein YndB with AHSA1/START domain
MSGHVGENGRRSVQVEVEVPGSPEEVWKAIATGPGISSWFVPTEVEEREGGKVTANFGPGMESVSTITQWNPPQNFVAEGSGMSPDSPPMATQWIVEAKSGDTCLVRVVHSWFASTDEWDSQYESVENGWVGFFSILRLKLKHFLGQSSVAFDVTGIGNYGESEGWAALTAPFGLTGAAEGVGVSSGSDTPALAGKVEVARTGDEMSMILLITEPGPGICQFFAVPMGGQTYLSIRFFLFGDNAASIVAQAEPEWSRWFGGKFPMEG